MSLSGIRTYDQWTTLFKKTLRAPHPVPHQRDSYFMFRYFTYIVGKNVTSAMLTHGKSTLDDSKFK